MPYGRVRPWTYSMPWRSGELQMHGTLDESIPIDAARALTSRLVDARFVAIDGSSHDVHIDAPDRVAEEVTAFVATLPP